MINQGILTGKSSNDITKEILDKVNVSASKARFWAEDQAAIFQAEQTRVRAVRKGYTHYRWRISGSNTRPSHAVHDRKVYSLNVGVTNLSRPGARHPGEDYRCHCWMELLTAEQAANLGYKNDPPRRPQSVQGLVENYEGNEETRLQKAIGFIQTTGQQIQSFLRGNRLSPDKGKLIVGSESEIQFATAITSSIEANKLNGFEKK
ncbi:MAG: phage minor head protein [Leptospiraceae bacterium]|nr:phage minor head protein [Leptospiraceae bacterium]